MPKHFLSYLFFFITISLFAYLATYSSKIISSNNNQIKLCSNLSYNKSLHLHPDNFRKFDLTLKIHNERKWRKIAVEEELKRKKMLTEEGKHYFYSNRERVKATFIINIDKKLKCKILARIRIHGDFKDHRRGSGLPSLNVNITDGHIFGVVKFILFRPYTRNHDNEIFTTTLLRELGFLAPRTTNVNVEYNNLRKKFIFQEKIVKEFLESSLKREGALFEGDERFLSFDPHETLNLSKHRLVNKNWAKKEKTNQVISETALSILNEINQYHRITKPNVNQIDVVDYYTVATKVGMKNYFEKLPEFDSIIFSLEGEDSLSRDDRRFYYDSSVKKFYPIYYDGSTNLLSKNNRIQDLPLANIKDINKNIPQFRLGRITPSAVSGSNNAYKAFKNLKTEKLYFKLKRYGVNINKDTVDQLIVIIKNRLLILKDFEKERIFTVDVDIKSKSYMPTSFVSHKNIKRRYIYYNENFNEYLSCDIYGENCKEILLDDIRKIKSLAQELIDKNNNSFIFVGKKRKTLPNEGWYSHFIFKKKSIKDNIKKKVLSKNTNLTTYGDIDYEINNSLKIISISKNDEYGRIIFSGGVLDGWKIMFKNNYKISINNNFHKRVDANGFTGCVSFFDIKIINTSIETINSDCEDAVNFVRSEGSIDSLIIQDSLYDALDADFSSLRFKSINVQKANNDCIDFSFGKYILKNVTVESCGDKGISVGESSNVVIDNLLASNSKTGLASKDFAKIFVNKGLIKTTNKCIEAYNKKQEFSGGFIKADNLNCKNSNKNLSVDDKSLFKGNIL